MPEKERSVSEADIDRNRAAAFSFGCLSPRRAIFPKSEPSQFPGEQLEQLPSEFGSTIARWRLLVSLEITDGHAIATDIRAILVTCADSLVIVKVCNIQSTEVRFLGDTTNQHRHDGDRCQCLL